MKKKMWLLGLLVVVVTAFVCVPLLQAVETARNVEQDACQRENDQVEARELTLEQMQAVIDSEGYTFTIGHNPAMQYPLEQLCTLNPDLAGPEDILLEGDEMEGLDSAMALPSAYTGYYTSIKNQGSCGSCWAFSIVGCFEGAYKKKTGSSPNWSEQYVLDCNTNGYSCSGGWFTAMNMNCSPYGSRTESCYPYVAYKKTCSSSCSYVARATSWAYVGSSSGVPSTDSIKQKIYDKGIVSAAVTADSYFQAYKSGCYSRNNTGSINHAILLVGWDNTKCTTGAWRLKNSWGTGWGESGLMWIKYGVSRVGYAACYVNY
jgi:C1A family cysteine protease